MNRGADHEPSVRRTEERFDDEQVRRTAETLEDAALHRGLVAAGYDGAVWWRCARDLTRYGHAVVVAWLRTGEMFAQCRRKGCYPGPPPLSWRQDDLHAVAEDTVSQAILDFRDRALAGGGWRPDGGASLKTYFVGRCVLAFPNAYRKWRAEQWHRQHLAASDSWAPGIAGVSSCEQDPADLALRRLSLWEGFDGIPDERTKKAILLQEAGYRVEEIARALGEPTGNVIRGVLARQRRRGGHTGSHR